MNLPITQDKLQEVRNIILSSKHIGITMHSHPDGDAIGSSIGLYLLLKNLGLKVDVITPNEYPEFISWMKDNDSVIIGNKDKSKTLEILSDLDLLIMLDFNVSGRIDWMEQPVLDLKCKKLIIDHHPLDNPIADYIISDTSKSSTAELVYYFIKECEWDNHIDKNIAESLYCGILTDTGCFNYNSSKPATFDAVGELLKIGVRKDWVFAKIYNNFSFDRMRLLGHALTNRMTIIPEYNTAYIYLSIEDLNNFNFEPGDTEGFVNYPLSIAGIKFTALFIEKENFVKISFRSSGDFPTNLFSTKNFNGGGHKNASGGNSPLNLKETIKKFVSILPEYAKILK